MRLLAQNMTLRDHFAIHAPQPSEEDIKMQQTFDQQRNPHNDGPPRPKRRSRVEIVCDLRYEFADQMIRTRQAHEDLLGDAYQ